MSIDRKEDYNPTILSRKLMVIDKIQKEVINQQDIPAVEDQLFEMAEENKLVSSSKKGTGFGHIDLIKAASKNPFNSILATLPPTKINKNVKHVSFTLQELATNIKEAKANKKDAIKGRNEAEVEVKLAQEEVDKLEWDLRIARSVLEDAQERKTENDNTANEERENILKLTKDREVAEILLGALLYLAAELDKTSGSQLPHANYSTIDQVNELAQSLGIITFVDALDRCGYRDHVLVARVLRNLGFAQSQFFHANGVEALKFGNGHPSADMVKQTCISLGISIPDVNIRGDAVMASSKKRKAVDGVNTDALASLPDAKKAKAGKLLEELISVLEEKDEENNDPSSTESGDTSTN